MGKADTAVSAPPTVPAAAPAQPPPPVAVVVPPAPVAEPASAPQPAVPGVAQVGPRPAASPAPRSVAQAPVRTAPAKTPSAAPAAAPAAPAAATLDLPLLEQRLKDTRAIGVFTKLSLKNQVDDLLTQFRAYHKGGSQQTLPQLRQSYEVLLIKVVSLIQNDDPKLAAAVGSSREAIWGVLSDPKKFATLNA